MLHADETPVAMLKPGNGKTHRAYLWAYSPGAFEDIKAVVYDFTETRSGKNAEEFLGDWRGKLVCDDYSGYKATLAKARNRMRLPGPRAAQVLRSARGQQEPDRRRRAGLLRQLYEVEREVQDLDAEARREVRQARPSRSPMPCTRG